MDVSKTIYSDNWQLFERKGWVYLQDNFGTKIVLSPANARDVWQVLNKWIERNAPDVEEEE